MNRLIPEAAMKIAIGPLLFGWPEAKIREFYLSMAEESDVDILYLGEVVCSKRSISGVEWQLKLAAQLQESGKEVVLSTLAMPTTERELQFIRDLTAAAGEMGLTIEANDMASVAVASRLGVEFVAGPHMNIYSHGTLQQMCRNGAKRVVLPLELPAKDIPDVVGQSDVEVEYFAHGHLPLTFSARCYTARSHGLSKQECRHVCFLNPDGIEMHTLDDHDFATINGTQIMSHRPFTAINHLAELAGFGVRTLRLSPQASGMPETLHHFRAAADGLLTGDAALNALTGGAPAHDCFCNGYYHGRQGRVWIEA
ncbi:MAG: U32 family peptidase [Mariprofundaceae bacterium]|nr:U32 family peptidase [Mariprofundaceae bacterium]